MADRISRKQFLAELETIVEMAKGALKGSEALNELPNWDSMTKLAIIAMVEQKTGLVMDGQAIGQAATIGDLFSLLGDRLLD